MAKTHIVKRRGHKEEFDERKVYISCFSACRSAHMDDRETAKVCDSVKSVVKRWIRNKKSVTSQQIFMLVKRELAKKNRDAAFMYETHKDIF